MSELIPAWIDGRLAPVKKSDAHRLGLRHKVVSVFVMHGQDVLIQRRACGKVHSAGLWADTCRAHPRWDEDPATCARRRLREELGITGVYPSHTCTVEYRAEVGRGVVEHEVADLFVGSVTERPAVAPAQAEVADTAWRDLYELAADAARNPDRYAAWLRIHLTNHLDTLFSRRLRQTIAR